jgi:putative transposase
MERFFRSLETEWVRELGYRSFTEAQQSITEYLVGYYSQTRPHHHNRGLSPDAAEKRYWISYSIMASFT